MSSTSTKLPRHSTGWKVGRLLTDRAGKALDEAPHQWGRHRALSTEDRIRRASAQLAGIVQARALTRR